MKFASSYQGKQTAHDIDKEIILIGRPSETEKPDLDFSADVYISRAHALIWFRQNSYWIKDLDSKLGTKINGKEIKGDGKKQLKAGDVVSMGDTTLRLDVSPGKTFPVVDFSNDTVEAKILTSVEASTPFFDVTKNSVADWERQSSLMELPLEFAAQTELEALLLKIIRRAVEIIPGAKCGSLMLHRSQDDALLLTVTAGQEKEKLILSRTLSRRALLMGKAFIWQRKNKNGDESGIYAPLLWNGKTCGILVVSNPHNDSAFTNDNLRFATTLARYAACSVAQFWKE